MYSVPLRLATPALRSREPLPLSRDRSSRCSWPNPKKPGPQVAVNCGDDHQGARVNPKPSVGFDAELPADWMFAPAATAPLPIPPLCPKKSAKQPGLELVP